MHPRTSPSVYVMSSANPDNQQRKEVLMNSDMTMALPDCVQLIHQMFYFLDESKYEQLVALFTPNGSLHRQGELLIGHDQIMQAMVKRATTQRIRHVISNAFIESQTKELVRLVAYMTAYRFDDGVMHKGPVEINRPFRISIVRAAMQQTGEAWKIVEMTFTPEFEFASAVCAAKDSVPTPQ